MDYILPRVSPSRPSSAPAAKSQGFLRSQKEKARDRRGTFLSLTRPDTCRRGPHCSMPGSMYVRDEKPHSTLLPSLTAGLTQAEDSIRAPPPMTHHRQGTLKPQGLKPMAGLGRRKGEGLHSAVLWSSEGVSPKWDWSAMQHSPWVKQSRGEGLR